MFLFPPPQFNYFPSSFLNSLPLHNINLSPPPPHSFFPPSQFLVFSLLLYNFIMFPPPPPHLFNIFFHPQIHRPPIDPTSTPHRPHIDSLSTPHRPFIDLTSTPHQPNIDPRLNFFSTQLGE